MYKRAISLSICMMLKSRARTFPLPSLGRWLFHLGTWFANRHYATYSSKSSPKSWRWWRRHTLPVRRQTTCELFTRREIGSRHITRGLEIGEQLKHGTMHTNRKRKSHPALTDFYYLLHISLGSAFWWIRRLENYIHLFFLYKFHLNGVFQCELFTELYIKIVRKPIF